MFSNGYLEAKNPNGVLVGNEEFLSDLVEWVFGNRGLLRSSQPVFYKPGGQDSTEMTINDSIVYFS